MKEKISTYAKKNDMSYLTVYNMVKRGELKSEQLPSGSIRIITENSSKINHNKVILYARASSSENKSNLESQMNRLREYACAKGYTIIKEVKEVGSGLNDKRKQLESIFKNNDWSKIIVEHKDRLARFGVNFIEVLLQNQEKSIEVINKVENNSKEDIMQDFVSIITSFTERLYGLRCSKRKTEQIIKELTKDNE